MNTPSLFGKARRNAPQTSRDAARTLHAPTREEHYRLILAALASAPEGLTDQELQDVTGIGESSERPRRGELAEQGRIVLTGKKRKTRAGKVADVWGIKR